MIEELKAKKALQAVTENLHNAVAFYAVYEKAAYDDRLNVKLDDTYAANAFKVLRKSLHYMVVLSLSRIWDDTKNALSIKKLKTYLADPRTQSEIFARRRNAMLGLDTRPEMVAKYGNDPTAIANLRKISEQDGADAATETKAEIDRCIAQIDIVISCPEMAPLKNFRHKVIAHTLEVSWDDDAALKKGQTIRNLKYGDETKLLEMTVPIVVALHQLVDELGVNFDNTGKVWKRYSDEFWNSVHGTH